MDMSMRMSLGQRQVQTFDLKQIQAMQQVLNDCTHMLRNEIGLGDDAIARKIFEKVALRASAIIIDPEVKGHIVGMLTDTHNQDYMLKSSSSIADSIYLDFRDFVINAVVDGLEKNAKGTLEITLPNRRTASTSTRGLIVEALKNPDKLKTEIKQENQLAKEIKKMMVALKV